jgi:hypothetical protein
MHFLGLKLREPVTPSSPRLEDVPCRYSSDARTRKVGVRMALRRSLITQRAEKPLGASLPATLVSPSSRGSVPDRPWIRKAWGSSAPRTWTQFPALPSPLDKRSDSVSNDEARDSRTSWGAGSAGDLWGIDDGGAVNGVAGGLREEQALLFVRGMTPTSPALCPHRPSPRSAPRNPLRLRFPSDGPTCSRRRAK